MRWFIQIFILVSLLFSCDNNPLLRGDDVQELGIRSISKYKNDEGTDILIFRKEFSESGDITSFEEYTEDGNLSSKSEYEHNMRGFKQSKEIFSTDGSIEIINIDYTTGEDGKVIGYVEYNELGQENSTASFDYDSDGNLVGIRKCTDHTEIQFDINENIGSAPFANCDSDEFLSYEFSNDGQVQNVYAVDKSGEFLWRDSISYLENSSIRKIKIDREGNIRYLTNFTYNAQGELKSEDNFSALGELLSSFRYTYTYYW
jgi:hypothetical protein